MTTMKFVWHVFALVRAHLFNLGTLATLLVIGIQLTFCAFLALVGSTLVRHYVVPNMATAEIPLHFTFSTCTDQLYGVCSFPTARAHLDPSQRLDPDLAYSLAVSVQLQPRLENENLGQFQLSVTLFDRKGDEQEPLRSYRRTVSIRPLPGWIWTLTTLWLRPLWWILSVSDATRLHIDVPLTGDYTESDLPEKGVHFLDVVLEHRNAIIDSGALRVSARFGLIRTFIVYYPFMSFLVTTAVFFLGFASVVAMHWSVKILIVLPQWMIEEESGRPEIAAPETVSSLQEEVSHHNSTE